MAEKQGRVSSKRSTGKKYKDLDKKFKVLVVFGIIFCIAGIPMIIWGGMWAYNTFAIAPANYFYDFEDDKLGSIPSEFTGTGRRFEEVQVVQWDKLDGHYGKVVEIGYFKERELFGTEFSILFEKSTKGIVEFDIYVENVVNRIYLDLCQEDVIYDYRDDVAIRMWNSGRLNIWALNEIGSLGEISAFHLKRWYHFKIEFDTETGWDLLIVGYLEYDTFNHFQFYRQPEYFSQLYFATYVIGSKFYIDNVKIGLNELY